VQISLEARIIALADAFDAMTNDRSYRKGLSINQTIEEIEKCSGTQFDRAIAAVFVELLKAKLTQESQTSLITVKTDTDNV
jgi:HD-GYP domain-containing protein (c-di-GMP phosphodiesterase class II)